MELGVLLVAESLSGREVFVFCIGIIETLFFVIQSFLIIPTYKKVLEHEKHHPRMISMLAKFKEVHLDFMERSSPQADELRDQEKILFLTMVRNIEQLTKDVIELTHNVRGMRNPIQEALTSRNQDLDLKDELRNLIEKLNKKL